MENERVAEKKIRGLFVFALSLLACVFSLSAATLPSGFVESQVGSNLSGSPTAMAFAPDGRLFVCLQNG